MSNSAMVKYFIFQIANVEAATCIGTKDLVVTAPHCCHEMLWQEDRGEQWNHCHDGLYHQGLGRGDD